MRKSPVFLALLAAFVCAVALGAHTPAGAEAPSPLRHYLVLGLDYYAVNASSSARSDTILLITLDPGGNRILFTSILRDSKVTTPGGGENKLNSVFANYGLEGAKSTVERHLGVSVEGVIAIDFETVKELIDAFGGVDIEISLQEYRWIHSILLGKDPNMPQGPGVAHMTGRIALAYMRDRHSGGSDFSRTEHQRKVLVQLMEKASLLSLPDMLHLFNEISGKVRTDMGPRQMLTALQTAYLLKNAQVTEHRVPADRTYVYDTLRGSSVLSVRWKLNRELFQDLLYPPAEGAEP